MLDLPLEQRETLGRRLSDLVRLAEMQKGALPDRWKQNEEYYENAQDQSEDETGMVQLHVNFSQPRQDMLTAMVCGVICRQDPYMIARDLRDGKRAKRLEKALHFFWQRAKFENKARHASTVCTNTNKAIWKLSWRSVDKGADIREQTMKTGLVIEVIHPNNFVKSPGTTEPIEDSRFIGNRVYRRLKWVKEKQEAGEFYADARATGGATQEQTDTTGSIDRSKSSPSLSGSELDDQLLELYFLNAKIDIQGWLGGKPGPEKWYCVWLSPLDYSILYLDDHPYSRPQFFESAFIPDGEVYWTGRSVAYNLQGPQAAYDTFFSGFYNGAMTEAMPIVIGDLPEKYTKTKFGDVVNTEDMVRDPYTVPSSFSAGQAFMAGLQIVEKVGDQAARVSANSAGTRLPGDATATEASQVAAGVQSGQEEYIANFSEPLAAMAMMTEEMLKEHWGDWWPLMGLRPVTEPAIDPATGYPVLDESGNPAKQPVLGPDNQPLMVGMVDLAKEDLDAPINWEATGKTPGNTPQARLQAASALHSIGMSTPETGYRPYEGFRMMVDAAGLNADAVQMSEEEMQAQQAAMQQQQMMQAMGQAQQ